MSKFINTDSKETGFICSLIKKSQKKTITTIVEGKFSYTALAADQECFSDGAWAAHYVFGELPTITQGVRSVAVVSTDSC